MIVADKIFFHGAGLVTALGDSVDENLRALEATPQSPSVLDFSYMDKSQKIPYHTIRSSPLALGADRIYQVIDKVISQAIDSSGYGEKDLSRMGLFVGSTSFDIFSGELSIKESNLSEENISRHIPPFTRLTAYISQKYKILGPVYSINTACTSSANALRYAAEFIRNGDIDEAIVVGLEFFNEMTALGFSGLELISKSTMRPFQDDRDGLILGEGCSALIISKRPAEHGFGYLAGANLGDNFSITACNSDGSTVAAVVEKALRQAGLSSEEIVMVKAHGTASLSNDEAEALGLHQVFSTIPPVVALKPVIGHTLGACGTNELILFYHSLIKGCLPSVSPENSASKSFGLTLHDGIETPSQGHFLLNYFGFGGNNTALVISNV